MSLHSSSSSWRGRNCC
uniref:Uncharacterized protein n=1 Tax=Arundo donax TaxID=35708 RepID=A0A0A8YMN2_ARUDO